MFSCAPLDLGPCCCVKSPPASGLHGAKAHANLLQEEPGEENVASPFCQEKGLELECVEVESVRRSGTLSISLEDVSASDVLLEAPADFPGISPGDKQHHGLEGSEVTAHGGLLTPERKLASSSALEAQEAQIAKDIPRTFCEVPQVIDRTRVIRKVLLDYAAKDPDVGYCQGMSFVAAVVSAHVADPLEASQRFQEIIRDVRGLWLPGFPLFVAGILALEVLFRRRLPDLYAHFAHLQMMLDSFLPDVWLTLFAKWLPFPQLWPALHFLEGHGFVGVLSLTLEVMRAHAQALQAAGNFDALYRLLKRLHDAPIQPNIEQVLASAAASISEARETLATPPEQLEEGSLLGPGMLVSAASRSSSSMSLTRQGAQVLNSWSGIPVLEDSERLRLLYTSIVYRLGSAVHTVAHDAASGAAQAVSGAKDVAKEAAAIIEDVRHSAKSVAIGAKDVAAGAAMTAAFAAISCEKALASALAADQGAYKAAAAAAHLSHELREALAVAKAPISPHMEATYHTLLQGTAAATTAATAVADRIQHLSSPIPRVLSGFSEGRDASGTSSGGFAEAREPSFRIGEGQNTRMSCCRRAVSRLVRSIASTKKVLSQILGGPSAA